MREYVLVLTPTTSDDGEGGQSVDWDTAPAVAGFAEIRSATAREQAIAGSVQSVVSHTVRMHYDTRITTTKRIERVRDGLTLEILGQRDPDGRQREWELFCAEVI